MRQPDEPDLSPDTCEEAVIVPVALSERSYEIRIVDDDGDGFSPYVRRLVGDGRPRIMVVTDENVASLASRYREELKAGGLPAELAVVPAGESSKSLEETAQLYDRFLEHKLDRHGLVVAVGGGVVGDLSGFAAATYLRGVRLLMVPTSLLAQVDSSVGGKVGVNLPRGKNLIGAFHQPVGVWIDTVTLRDLPDRQLVNGLAEVVKYGFSLDAPFLDWLEGNIAAVLGRDAAALRRVIARCCELKARVVEQDEREVTGLRAVLNFGHTVGHAVEALSGYGGGMLHGEAVAIGMVLETRLAARLGWISEEKVGRLAAILGRVGLPTSLDGLGLGPDALLDAMGRDKKNRDGRIRMVLPRAVGRVELSEGVPPDLVREVVSR